jgi:hypothetical protein
MGLLKNPFYLGFCTENMDVTLRDAVMEDRP